MNLSQFLANPMVAVFSRGLRVQVIPQPPSYTVGFAAYIMFNMFRFIRQIAADDGAVKALFDHVRNLGIASVVFGAAVWQFQHPGDGSAYYFSMAIVLLLVAFAIFLFYVNQLHGMIKLRAAGYPGWVFQIALHTYSLVTVTLIASLVWRTA